MFGMNTSVEVSFGAWLKRRRKAMGLTQEQLAQQLNYSTILLRKIEAEERHPSAQIIERLAEVFKITSSDRKAFFRFARGDWQAALLEVGARSTPRSHLPASTTSFIGREKEIKEIAGLFSTSRLITLTGSGGVGKTRLALQIAREQQASFADGVWFIEFASLAQPELVPSAVAAVMGLQEVPTQPVNETLVHFLKSKKLLLVLDNCEHLIEACARLADDLLCACPELSILATSRELLRIPGELIWQVSSLMLPDPQRLPPLEKLNHYEAVRLLVERARLVNPSFNLTEQNACPLAQLCCRLDGMPLALELAAALVNVLTVEQILAGVNDRFRLLARGSRTALDRQQTLRATIDWSYNLLSESERELFCRLAVFSGGWSLEATEQVCVKKDEDGRLNASLEIHPFEAFELLTQLVNKSLVVVERGRAARYRLPETIRQYAWEKLGETGEEEYVRDQHLNYFLKLAEGAEPQLTGPDQITWLDRLDTDLENIRLALVWSLEKNAEAGLRLTNALHRFWMSRNDLRECREWLSQLLTRSEVLPRTTARAKALLASYMSSLDGRQRARVLVEESLALYRELGDKHGEAFSLFVLGNVQDDLFSARPLLAESLALYRELGDKLGSADALGALGSVNINDVVQARAHLEESLALWQELGHLAGMGHSLTELGWLAIRHGDYSLARQRLEEAAAIQRRLGERGVVGYLSEFGRLAFREGDYEQARAYCEESFSFHKERGNNWAASWIFLDLGYIALRQGEVTRAHAVFEEGLRNFREAGIKIGVIFALEGLASLAIVQGQLERAARLFAWADATREAVGEPRPPIEQDDVDRDLATIHSQLDDETFASAQAAGRVMNLEQASAYALGA